MFSFRLTTAVATFLLSNICFAATPASFAPSAEPVADYPTGQPIPTAPNAPVGRTLRPFFDAWSKRVIVDVYQRLNPGETNVLAFVCDASIYLHGGSENTRADLDRRARQLGFFESSSDPMALFLAGLVTNNERLREKLYQRSTELHATSGYSRFLLFLSAANLAKCLQDRNAPAAEITAADETALEALRQGLHAESFHGGESIVLRARLDAPSVDSLLKRQAQAMIGIFQNAQAMPDWVRAFSLGKGYLAAAWKARSDGFASEVTEAGWRGWQANLPKARQHFTRSWELNPHDPAASTYMIEVAMGNGGDKDEMRRWFDRAVVAQMDYFDAYRSLIWALRPRWHGSHEEMLLFGDELLGTGRFDTCVPFYYFKVVGDVASELSDTKAIYTRPEIADNLRLALERYLAMPNSPLDVSYAHTVLAILDFQAGNLEAAKRHMATIHFKANRDVHEGLREDLSRLMKLIAPPATGMANGATTSAP